MADPPGRKDRAFSEFFSEAQEIIEWLNRDLLLLDQCVKKGEQDPDLVNNVFRAVHTLKGLSGLFAVQALSSLTHNLENLLDDLRLGRTPLTEEVLDLLFESVERSGQILTQTRDGKPPDPSTVEDFVRRIERASASKPKVASSKVGDYEIEESLLQVLTEYEEHRLRTNIAAGANLFRLSARFQLAVIDTELEELKRTAKPHGEIITFLPSATGSEEDSIDLEIILASSRSWDELDGVLASDRVVVTQVPRRRATIPPPPPPSIAPPRDVTPIVDAELPLPFEEGELVAAPVTSTSLEAARTPSTIRSVSQTVRVDIRKLDRLMNIVGELSLFGTALGKVGERLRMAGVLKELGPELHRMNRGFDRHLAELQEGILEVRMVPLGQVFDKLARIVRQISREVGKEMRFVVSGAETEVDKLIVEELSDPLMHLIRNAIDHGIERTTDRQALGKPAVGTVALNAFQKGSHVVIEVEDDGRGIDEEHLREVAIERGFLSVEASREMSRADLLGLIFLPGFSTKREADEVSGRGVGMDVVKTNIARLGGVIDVQSDLGIGTKMTITLPITLAIISALIVEIDGRTLAMPLSAVQEALALRPSQIRSIEGREILTLRGATLPLCRLAALFAWRTDPPSTDEFVVVAGMAGRRVGFVVDRLIGQQDIVIKALGASLQEVGGLSGATDLGGDGLALVLDVPALVDEVLAQFVRPMEAAPRP